MDDMLAGHERRISRLEDQMSDVRITLTRIERDLAEGNRMTAEIRDSTGELVTLTKSLKLIGRIAAWGGGLTTLAAGLYALASRSPM